MGQLPVTQRGIRPLLIGDHVPKVDLIDSNGNNVNLKELTEGKPTILSSTGDGGARTVTPSCSSSRFMNQNSLNSVTGL